MDRIALVLADAQQLFLEALSGAVALQPDLVVVGQAASGLQAIDAFALHSPDVVVLDYWLGEMNGAATTRQICERHPEARVLILAWLYGPSQLAEARAAGVAGFVSKSVGLDELVTVVRAIHGGISVFPGTSPSSPLQWTRPAGVREAGYLGLSPRELQILQLFCEGESRGAVARELGIREGTVKNHVHNILVKTGSRTLLAAVTLARNEGLVRESGQLRKGRPGLI